jgi:hypothetical protein
MKPGGQHEWFPGLHGVPLEHGPQLTFPPHWSSIVVLHAVCREQLVGSHVQLDGPWVVNGAPHCAVMLSTTTQTRYVSCAGGPVVSWKVQPKPGSCTTCFCTT